VSGIIKLDEIERFVECPICYAPLNAFTVLERNSHTEQCLRSVKNGDEEYKVTPKFQFKSTLNNSTPPQVSSSSYPSDSSPECAVCALDLSLKSIHARMRHVNRCLDSVSNNSNNPIPSSNLILSRSKQFLHAWLCALGLSRYSALFEKHQIDFATLKLLNAKDLKGIGVPKSIRKRIADALPTLVLFSLNKTQNLPRKQSHSESSENDDDAQDSMAKHCKEDEVVESTQPFGESRLANTSLALSKGPLRNSMSAKIPAALSVSSTAAPISVSDETQSNALGNDGVEVQNDGSKDGMCEIWESPKTRKDPKADSIPIIVLSDTPKVDKVVALNRRNEIDDGERRKSEMEQIRIEKEKKVEQEQRRFQEELARIQREHEIKLKEIDTEYEIRFESIVQTDDKNQPSTLVNKRLFLQKNASFSSSSSKSTHHENDSDVQIDLTQRVDVDIDEEDDEGLNGRCEGESECEKSVSNSEYPSITQYTENSILSGKSYCRYGEESDFLVMSGDENVNSMGNSRDGIESGDCVKLQGDCAVEKQRILSAALRQMEDIWERILLGKIVDLRELQNALNSRPIPKVNASSRTLVEYLELQGINWFDPAAPKHRQTTKVRKKRKTTTAGTGATQQ